MDGAWISVSCTTSPSHDSCSPHTSSPPHTILSFIHAVGGGSLPFILPFWSCPCCAFLRLSTTSHSPSYHALFCISPALCSICPLPSKRWTTPSKIVFSSSILPQSVNFPTGIWCGLLCAQVMMRGWSWTLQVHAITLHSYFRTFKKQHRCAAQSSFVGGARDTPLATGFPLESRISVTTTSDFCHPKAWHGAVTIIIHPLLEFDGRTEHGVGIFLPLKNAILQCEVGWTHQKPKPHTKGCQ